MKNLFLIFVFLFSWIILTAQNNNTFNYQAVAHDPLTNQILANQDLNVKFYIGTNAQDPDTDYDYYEEHTLTTNDFGLFYTKVGNGDPALFDGIQWGVETYYLTVVIDNILVSTDLLVAVPYSIAANNANTVNNLTVETAVPANATFSDNQSLSITSDSLIISNGNGVSLDDLRESNWTATGNDMQNNNPGKVGIGTNSFVGKLNITTDANTERGLYILNNTSSNSTFGKFGVYANVDGGGTGDNVGAWFDALGNATGINYGVAGYASGTNGENRGVFGAANNGTSNWAGYFSDGDVKVENKLVIGSNTSPGQLQLIDGNQGFNRILRSDAQGNAEWVQIGTMGVGVMLKSVYDINNDGVVDDAETVTGFQVGSNVPANAIFTDDQDATSVFYDNTSSNLNANTVQDAIDEVNQNISNSNTAINDLTDGYTDNNNNLYLTSTPNSNITSASHNIAIGIQSLSSNTTGDNNIAIGKNSLLQSNSSDQIAIGTNTLSNTTSGIFNTAVGHFALSNNTSGQHNNAFGYTSLFFNTSGNANSAFGHWTLRGNTTGYGNTAVGHATLYNNTIGNTNTAVGKSAMFENISGNYNTALGEVSLKNNTTGDGNVAVGHKSLETNTTGEFNVAIGSYALQQSTTSSSNVALGERALDNNTTGQENVAVGRYALTDNTTGSNNTALGFNASVGSSNLTNATAIGANATVDISDALILGNNANVGIGTSSPSEKLDVDGNIRMRNGASSGYILVSDNNGVMHWTSPDSIAANSNINDLNDGYTDQYNNVYLSSNVSSNLSSASPDNIALGQGTLNNNSGNGNIAIGVNALNQNTSGSINIGIGTRSLSQNQSGYGNTAVGYQSLENNTTGSENTSVGQNTMSSNTTGGQNTAFGGAALSANTTGNANVAIGLNTQYKNTDGFGNSAVGYGALFENVSGGQNAALGMNSLENNTGSNNSAIGYLAGNQQTNGNNNTFIGYNANTTAASSSNLNNATAIGANTTVEQSNSVVIGNNADVGIGTSNPGHNTGASRYMTISSGTGNPSFISSTSLELIGGSSSGGGLQNRIDFIARSTSGNNYTTGRLEMVNESNNTGRGIMKFYTKNQISFEERMSINEGGEITFGSGANSYSFPSNIGNDGQLLAVDSSNGNLVWIDGNDLASTLGLNSPWTKNPANNSISRINGNVGIGTSSPDAKAHIVSYSDPQLILGNTNQPNYEWKTFVNQTGDLKITNENNGSSMNPSITLMNNGKVGVGNSNPQKTLHIYGEVTNFPNAEPSNGNDGVFIDIQNAGAGYEKVAGIRFKTRSGLFENAYYHAGIFFRGNPNDMDQRGTLYFSNKNNLNATGVGTADADMVIKSDGKIGIGTLIPDEQLHVDGKLKIGNSSGGYILPDASGQPGQVLKMPSSGNQLTWGSVGSTNIGFFAGIAATSDQTFSAGGSSTTILFGNGYNNFNDGNGYDYSTGKFTAPEAGKYQINVNVQVQIPSPQSYGSLQLTIYHAGGKFGESITQTVGNSSGDSNFNITLSQTIVLTQGQSIWVTLYSTVDDGSIEKFSSSFSGYRVY